MYYDKGVKLSDIDVNEDPKDFVGPTSLPKKSKIDKITAEQMKTLNDTFTTRKKMNLEMTEEWLDEKETASVD